MKDYTYTDIAIKAKELREKYPQLRKGQSLINALGSIDTDLCNEIVGTEADCYYFDGKIEKFQQAVNIYLCS